MGGPPAYPPSDDRDGLVPPRPAAPRQPRAAGRDRGPRVGSSRLLSDERLLGGRRLGPRTQFLLECLAELGKGIADRGGQLFVRSGRPERELAKLARDAGCEQVHFAYDVSPFARRRGERVAALREAGIEPVAHPGLNAVDVREIRTQGDKPYTVFPLPSQLGGDRASRGAAPPAPDPSSIAPRGRRLPSSPTSGCGRVSGPARGGRSERAAAWVHSSAPMSGATTTTTTPSARTALRGSRPTCTSGASRRARSRRGCRVAKGAEAFRRQLC